MSNPRVSTSNLYSLALPLAAKALRISLLIWLSCSSWLWLNGPWPWACCCCCWRSCCWLALTPPAIGCCCICWACRALIGDVPRIPAPPGIGGDLPERGLELGVDRGDAVCWFFSIRISPSSCSISCRRESCRAPKWPSSSPFRCLRARSSLISAGFSGAICSVSCWRLRRAISRIISLFLDSSWAISSRWARELSVPIGVALSGKLDGCMDCIVIKEGPNRFLVWLTYRSVFLGQSGGIAGNQAVLLVVGRSGGHARHGCAGRTAGAVQTAACGPRVERAGAIEKAVLARETRMRAVVAMYEARGVREAVVRWQRRGRHDVRQVERLLRLVGEAGEHLHRLLGHTAEALAQRVTDLFARRLVARVLLDLVIVLVIQRCLAVPEALLTQLVGVTPLTAITKPGEVFLVANRADSRMHNGLHGGQPVHQRQPDEAGRPRLGHQRGHKVVHRHLILGREDLLLEPLLVVECGRLVHGRRQGQHFAQELAQLPGHQLSSAIRDLREYVCPMEKFQSSLFGNQMMCALLTS